MNTNEVNSIDRNSFLDFYDTKNQYRLDLELSDLMSWRFNLLNDLRFLNSLNYKYIGLANYDYQIDYGQLLESYQRSIKRVKDFLELINTRILNIEIQKGRFYAEYENKKQNQK